MILWNLTNYKLVKKKNFKDKLIVSLTALLNEYLVIGLDDNSINIISINYFLLLKSTPIIVVRLFQLESLPLKLAFLPNKDLVAVTSNGNIYLINKQIKKKILNRNN